ncbi:hypothetical protein EST38_g9706 [Candolleomyces aberdarensis]|uniref:Glycosyl hydrolase family 92 domain-containing protein n=1 Tax=Candolleomyces aberdarensis TaxID=2316362 RepID=A0A4V1Q2S9_9AGAR|nr:hypothetical protein EST38_g9706 [Candolleomyces aberdarensis]
MVGTHADSLIAEAALKNVSGFTTHQDRELARDAAWKDSRVASEVGHNDYTNELLCHLPYHYALSGAAYKTQERVQDIDQENRGNLADGLTGMGWGNEDCGRKNTWYIFSTTAFYLVSPVSREKSIFFTIKAPEARTKPFVKSLTINGVKLTGPVIEHKALLAAGGDGIVEVVFETSETVE